MEKVPVAVILADSLTQIALGGVNANEYPIRTLPERFRPDRRECRFDCFAVCASCEQVLSQSLQGMQSQLSPAVPL